MNILPFGATGTVGQGVLRECLLDQRVEGVTAVGRARTGQSHPKLSEIVIEDLTRIDTIEGRLSGFDACFFCVGVSSAGLSEHDYTCLTYDLTLRVANLLVLQ